MGTKRTTKWYRENEKEVMERLGLKPTKNSGSGWVEKEDGQNDYLICQLKSTDMGSISVKKKDLEILEYNASVSHKIPVFALQFIGESLDDVWIMMKPSDIDEVSKYIETGKCKIGNNFADIGENDIDVTNTGKKRKVIKSGRRSREQYERLRVESYEKRGKKGWCNNSCQKRR